MERQLKATAAPLPSTTRNINVEKEAAQINYEQDLNIDHTALDIECLNQSKLFMKYSELAADAKLELDRSKELLDVIRAECDKAIRENAKAGEKLTEAAIANSIVLNVRYREAVDNLNKAKYKYEILSAAVKAFEHRKSMLENLIKLMLGSYFAGPSVPRNLDKEVREGFRERMLEKSRQDTRQKIRERRRG